MDSIILQLFALALIGHKKRRLGVGALWRQIPGATWRNQGEFPELQVPSTVSMELLIRPCFATLSQARTRQVCSSFSRRSPADCPRPKAASCRRGRGTKSVIDSKRRGLQCLAPRSLGVRARGEETGVTKPHSFRRTLRAAGKRRTAKLRRIPPQADSPTSDRFSALLPDGEIPILRAASL